jgi:hypothetical protein
MTNTPESDTMKDNQMNERKLFEEFYKTITPAVPQAGYEDITMDAAYLAWKARAKQAEDGFQVTMSNTPMYKQAYDLIQSIESLGASPELTAVVTQAGKLMDEILKREMNFHHVCKAFNEINAPTFMGEPKLAAPQQAIPSGWKLVPIEPTDEMKEKGWEAYRDSNKPAPYNMLTDAYKAMLTASPTAPIESDK